MFDGMTLNLYLLYNIAKRTSKRTHLLWQHLLILIHGFDYHDKSMHRIPLVLLVVIKGAQSTQMDYIDFPNNNNEKTWN